MHYPSTFTLQWQCFLGIPAMAASAHLLALCPCSLAVVFSAVPLGLRLLEGRFGWSAAPVRGNCWLCLGRSEQTSPLQAFLEQNLVIWVVGRVSEWETDSLGAFFPSVAEPLLPGWTAALPCTLPLLFLLRNNVGDLWVIQISIFQPFSYPFNVFWGTRNKKGLRGAPPACSNSLQCCVQQVCVVPENTDY